MIELAEPLEDLVLGPQRFTGAKRFRQNLRVYDETLRDGEQMPGVAFSSAQKLEIAALLSAMGVHSIMAAFPASSRSDVEALQLLLKARRDGRLRKDLEIMTLARADKGDVDAIVDAARAVDVPPGQIGVLVLSTTSDLHIKYKLGRSLLKYAGAAESEWLKRPVSWYRRVNIDYIADAVAYCRRLGFATIEFAAEDASRGSREYLVQWARECRRAGGTRLCFSDTNGVLTPESVDHYFAGLCDELPGLDITAHFHNDFGLACANTVRALGHGASHASITACGIGERAGNAALHQVALALKELYDVELRGFAYERLWELRSLVERCSGVPIQPHEPIVGRNVFIHESGIHTAAIELHPKMYQFLDQRIVGGEHKFIYGKHSGGESIRHFVAKHGDRCGIGSHELTEAECEEITHLVKSHREARAASEDYVHFIGAYYDHLDSLGVNDEVVLAAIERVVRSRFPAHWSGVGG